MRGDEVGLRKSGGRNGEMEVGGVEAQGNNGKLN